MQFTRLWGCILLKCIFVHVFLQTIHRVRIFKAILQRDGFLETNLHEAESGDKTESKRKPQHRRSDVRSEIKSDLIGDQIRSEIKSDLIGDWITLVKISHILINLEQSSGIYFTNLIKVMRKLSREAQA